MMHSATIAWHINQSILTKAVLHRSKDSVLWCGFSLSFIHLFISQLFRFVHAHQFLYSTRKLISKLHPSRLGYKLAVFVERQLQVCKVFPRQKKVGHKKLFAWKETCWKSWVAEKHVRFCPFWWWPGRETFLFRTDVAIVTITNSKSVRALSNGLYTL